MFCEQRVAACKELTADTGEYEWFNLFDAEDARRFIETHSNENRGYVEKSQMEEFKYESGKLFSSYGIHEWLSLDEFRALDSEAQKAYVYFEWTSRYDVLNLLREIFVIADRFKEMYEHECGSEKPTDYRIVVGIG